MGNPLVPDSAHLQCGHNKGQTIYIAFDINESNTLVDCAIQESGLKDGFKCQQWRSLYPGSKIRIEPHTIFIDEYYHEH